MDAVAKPSSLRNYKCEEARICESCQNFISRHLYKNKILVSKISVKTDLQNTNMSSNASIEMASVVNSFVRRLFLSTSLDSSALKVK